MKAAVLVGGLGTRLRPAVGDRPKPLALVGGRPFLSHLLERLQRQGIVEVVLCAGYRWRDIEAALGDGAGLGLRIQFSVEHTQMGTAGALRQARPYLASTFLALNGDSFLAVDLARLVRVHVESRALATLALVQVPDAGAYGRVDVAPGGRIVGFHEKSGAGPGDGWVNGGVYVLEPRMLDLIPAGRPVSLERETFPLLVESGELVMGMAVQEELLDIGTPDRYRRAQVKLGGIEP